MFSNSPMHVRHPATLILLDVINPDHPVDGLDYWGAGYRVMKVSKYNS
jgi:hypothetical protein